MEIQGNSIIDTVIEYANVKFGVEMTAEQASKQLQNMTSLTHYDYQCCKK